MAKRKAKEADNAELDDDFLEQLCRDMVDTNGDEDGPQDDDQDGERVVKAEPETPKPRPTKARKTDASGAGSSARGTSSSRRSGGNSVLSSVVVEKLTHGATRRQRHVVLEKMVQAVAESAAKIDPVVAGSAPSEADVMQYMTIVEKRLFDGILGLPMHEMYNMYRGEVYRRMAFEIIYALRANGVNLMAAYSPELLASLPPHVLAKDTPAGRVYQEWQEKQDQNLAMEHELRRARNEERGVGFYACKKCGGRCELIELQTRSGDEGMSIWRRCIVCSHVKKN